MKENNQDGQTLVEILIAIAVMLTMYEGITDLLAYNGRTLVNERATASRDRVVASIADLAGMPSAIRASMINPNGVSGNDELNSCVSGSGCGSSLHRDVDFVLFRPILQMSPGGTVQVAGPISGLETSPLRFDMQGIACDPTKKQCLPALFPVEVYTKFRSYCPPKAAVSHWAGPVLGAGLQLANGCGQADSIEVKYWIRPTAGGPLSFVPYFGSTFISVSKIEQTI